MISGYLLRLIIKTYGALRKYVFNEFSMRNLHFNLHEIALEGVYTFLMSPWSPILFVNQFWYVKSSFCHFFQMPLQFMVINSKSQFLIITTLAWLNNCLSFFFHSTLQGLSYIQNQNNNKRPMCAKMKSMACHVSGF